jgi:hypothetical protein
MENKQTGERASRFLESALLITLLLHGAAMFSIALLLIPGLPGGGNPATARMTYVAENPWFWRLGWLPWHLTALSDVLLAIALLRTVWFPRPAAWLILLLTLAAFCIEQPGELAWTFQGIPLAQTGALERYSQLEAHLYIQVAGIAALLYALTACVWSWGFARAKIWHPWLTGLSILTWSVLIAVSVSPLLPVESHPDDRLVAAGNALGFALLLIWLAIVTELVLRRSRPHSPYGRMATWIHPRHNMWGRAANLLANSRLVRAYGEFFPLIAFKSDITDVIYVNYLVNAKLLAPIVPWGLELQCLGSEPYAMFTHLTYQHGHFGPRFLGGLRRFMPSPVQSNWRIYVRDPRTGQEGIYFVYTAISQLLPAIMARTLSEGLPMHLPEHAEVSPLKTGAFSVRVAPGTGSAPDLMLNATLTPVSDLPESWRACFADYRAMLAYCVPQDRALSSQFWYQRVTRQEIALGIPLDICQPLSATVVSETARKIVGDAEPVCFRVPTVNFEFDRELYDKVND